MTRLPIYIVMQQHVEEAAHLRHVRSTLVHAPNVRLLHLARLDERIAAHLDGIEVAGQHGMALCQSALASPGTGVMFVATVRAIESRDGDGLRRLLAVAQTAPESLRGMLSAFGWVSATSLRGIANSLLDSDNPGWRAVGLVACAMHGVNPGTALLQRAIEALTDSAMTSSGLRVAAALGRIELRNTCVDVARAKTSASTKFYAARAAALLGDRAIAIDILREFVSSSDEFRDAALAIWLRLVPLDEVRAALKGLVNKLDAVRTLIRAIGIAGDPSYVPWLIALTNEIALTRLAGDAFSLITGLDLAYLDLDRKPPDGLEFGPNIDPADTNVAMDEDDSLPWPDPDKIAAWWRFNGDRFAPGSRYFMGAPPSPARCLSVLKTGFQRQRIAAAEYLTLLVPGTPLFNTSAPAWRQQRWLDAMGP